MSKTKRPIKPNSFIDCEDINENFAIYSFSDNTLKQGKAYLSKKQIERISFLLALDLKNIVKTNSKISNMSANAVYTHLQNNQ